MSLIKRLLRGYIKKHDGSISVEIALSLPILLLCLTGIVELGHFLLILLKVQHTAVAVADLVTRDDTITEEVMDDIFLAVPRIMSPYDDNEVIMTVVTSITRQPDAEAEVVWQRDSGGYTAASSLFPSAGTPGALPTELDLEESQTVISAEVVYAYEPLVFRMIPPQDLRRIAFLRPRLGSLTEIE